MLLVTSNYNYEYKLIDHCNNFQSIKIEKYNLLEETGKVR